MLRAAGRCHCPASLSITEFIIVTYPEARRVLIDGSPVGMTDSLIFVDGGIHTISLEGAGYEPERIVHRFKGTSVSTPFTAEFQPITESEDA